MKKAELLAEQYRLLALANELAQRYWGVDYTGTLTLTARNWIRRGASFSWNRETGLQVIRMSAPVNARRTSEEVTSDLLHELVHWRLYTQGLPFSDTDDEFIAECVRVGAGISFASNAQKAYQAYMQKRAYEERTGLKYDDVA